MIRVNWNTFKCHRCEWVPPSAASSDDIQQHILSHYAEQRIAATTSPAPKTDQQKPIDPKDCPHPEFAANVDVNRFDDSSKFLAEITVKCSACGLPFRFVGVPAGLDFERPTCSITGVALNAPIEPELEVKIHTMASYHMPEIPKRH